MDDAFKHLAELIEAVEEENERLSRDGILSWDKDIPLELRDKLLVMGSSTNDYVFWIHRKAQPDDLDDKPENQMYYALEVETGIGAWGVTPREAVDKYWHADLLDVARDEPDDVEEN